jgi:hypothetical protein
VIRGSWKDLELTAYGYSNGLISGTVRRKAEQGQAMKSVQSETMKAFGIVIVVASWFGSGKVWSVSPRFIEGCSFLCLNFSLVLGVSVNIAKLNPCSWMDCMVQNPLFKTARHDCIPIVFVVRLENC